MQYYLPSRATISSCEEALAELEKAPKGLDHLVVPTKFRYGSFGAEVSWVQFILSWARRNKNCKLSTFAEESEDLQIEKFTEQMMGLVASLCSSDIRSHRNKTILTDYYKGLAIERLDKLQELRPNAYTKGQKIEVIANDDRGRDAPASLYSKKVNGRRELGSRPYFIRAASSLIKAILPTEKSITNDPSTDKAVGNLLYETFRNTHEHAKYDIAGNSLRHSFRIMQASYTAGLPDHLKEATKGVDPLQRYVSGFQSAEQKTQLTFLTLSILDSGPGFAQTYTLSPLKKLAFRNELEVTKNCFTSATRRHRPEYGLGLQLVREYLRQQRGFLRLRTGRVSLYYDGNLDKNLNDPIPLKLWTTTGAHQVAPVEGSLVSMHIPVGGTH